MSEHIEKYMNLLDLYYDIDNLGFIKNIELPLLEEYKSYHNSINYESSDIKKELIEERIGFLYSHGQRSFLKDTRGIKFDEVILEEIPKNIKKKYGVDVNTIILSHSGFIVVYSDIPHRGILSILLRRNKELFRSFGRVKENLSIEKNMDLFEIEINTGCEDVNVYEQLNIILRGFHSFRQCLDYEKCNDEIKRITDIIKRNEDTLNLLEGL